jgi:hypothetical protein
MGVLILRCIRIHSPFIAQPISSVRHPLNELITASMLMGGFALFVARLLCVHFVPRGRITRDGPYLACSATVAVNGPYCHEPMILLGRSTILTESDELMAARQRGYHWQLVHREVSPSRLGKVRWSYKDLVCSRPISSSIVSR